MGFKDYLVFLLILGNVFINLVSTTGGNIYIIITIALFFLFFGNTTFIYKMHRIILMYGFITIFAVIGLFYASNTNLIFDDLTKVVSNLLSMIIIWQYLLESENLKKLLKMIVVSVSLLALPNAVFASDGIREMFWGGVNPVAAMMFFSVISIFLLVYLKIRWVLWFLPLNLYVIFLTQSQKVILSLLIGIGIFLVINFVRKKLYENIKSIFAISLILLFCIVILKSESFSNTLFRTTATIQQFQSEERIEGAAGGSGYRTFLIEKGYDFFTERPFIGYGLNNSRDVYLVNTGKPTYSHNTWIEMLISFGFFITFIYLLIFMIVLVAIFNKFRKSADNLYSILFCALLMIILVGQFQKMYYNIFTHIFLLIVLYCVNYDKKLCIKY